MRRLLPLLAAFQLAAVAESVNSAGSPGLRRDGELRKRRTLAILKIGVAESNASQVAPWAPEELPIQLPSDGAWRKFRLWVPARAANFDEDLPQGVEVQHGPWRWKHHPLVTSRVQRWHHHVNPHREFWKSVSFWGWFVFFAALLVYVGLQIMLLDWPSTRWYHGISLLVWLLAAAPYNALLWVRFGAGPGGEWTTGYLLEFVFSLENIFLYHIVISVFKTPRKLAQKALFIVVLCQICFQMLFFMGLASMLQAIKVLPYLLGVWLLYVGYKTLQPEDESYHPKDSLVFRMLKYVFGDRLLFEYEEDRIITTVDGKTCITLLGPVVLCLFLIDLFMEVDVTLTKIEEISSHYIGFTSSAAAAFAVPSLFFVARDLFHRYEKLKYGVSFAILYFAVELLLHQVIHISDIVGLGLIAVVFVVCIAASKVRETPEQPDAKESIDDSIASMSKEVMQANEDLRTPCSSLTPTDKKDAEKDVDVPETRFGI